MKYYENYHSRAYELDDHNALKPTSLVQYLQETAEHQLRDQDVDYSIMYQRDRKAFILSRMSIEIDRPIHRFADLRAATWVTPGRAANFPRAYELADDEGVFIKAFSTWAMVDVDTKKLIRYNDYDVSHYASAEEPKLEIPLRFRIPKEIELREAQKLTVKHSMTDINGHMNNAIYFNHLYDNIPEINQLFITSMNIRYVHEAQEGATIHILMSDAVDSGELDPRAEKIIYFRTEVEGNVNVEAAFGVRKYHG